MDEWQPLLALLAIVGPATGAIFGALLLVQRELVSTLRAGIASCEKREEQRVADANARTQNAERREDTAFDRLGTTTTTINELAGAVREFATIGRSQTEEIRKNGELVASTLRRQETIERHVADLTYARGRPPISPPSSGSKG